MPLYVMAEGGAWPPVYLGSEADYADLSVYEFGPYDFGTGPYAIVGIVFRDAGIPHDATVTVGGATATKLTDYVNEGGGNTTRLSMFAAPATGSQLVTATMTGTALRLGAAVWASAPVEVDSQSGLANASAVTSTVAASDSWAACLALATTATPQWVLGAGQVERLRVVGDNNQLIAIAEQTIAGPPDVTFTLTNVVQPYGGLLASVLRKA